MNGVEKIIEQIRNDIQQEIDVMLAAAEEKAAAIKANYEAQAQEIYKEALNKGKQGAEDRLERQIRVAELEARKLLLEAKQNKINEAFQLAHKRLLALERDDQVALNARLIAFNAHSGQETIIMNQKDHDTIGKYVVAEANALVENGAFMLSDETRDMEGGLVISAGDIEVNCAYNTILRILRDDLAGDVAKILFDESFTS